MIKSEKEIEIMREAGRRLAHIVARVAREAAPGVSMKALDSLTHQLIMKGGDEPAFLGYRPEGATRSYPASICASVGGVVVHGVPTSSTLRHGDVLKLDFGLRHKGYCADMAVTVPIGEVRLEEKRLIAATKRALDAGIAAIASGKRLGDIGWAIEQAVRTAKFHVVRGLTGHGIGERLHEEPVVYNYGTPGKGLLLREGMTLAIEPMVAIGTDRVVQLRDDSFETADKSTAAHFEHTVLVGKDGPEILTLDI
ncbi:MAG: type I methionyl aminopeptidase [bacterium]|nr:type I methionyl aminopeptidase [bacterium]